MVDNIPFILDIFLMHTRLGIYINQQINFNVVVGLNVIQFGFFFKNTLIVQVRYITIETKEVTRIGHNGFPFPHEYSDEGRGAYIIYDNSSSWPKYLLLIDLFIRHVN